MITTIIDQITFYTQALLNPDLPDSHKDHCRAMIADLYGYLPIYQIELADAMEAVSERMRNGLS